MPSLGWQLLELYLRLGGGVVVGWFLGRSFPPSVAQYLGQFLFWIGVPIGIIAFLRRADLSGAIWLAPIIAWTAIVCGALLAWLWMRKPLFPLLHNGRKTFRGSLLLTSMFGNTGYLGYPIILSLLGEEYFGWAVFYDLLGTTLGAYGLGVFLGAYFGEQSRDRHQLALAVLRNPTLWALGFGLWFRRVPLPPGAEDTLQTIGWAVISLSLVLIGMRLSQIHSWQNLRPAAVSLGIKMLLVPLGLGLAISLCGLTGPPQLVMVLQMAMPPAFATLVIAEAFELDRELAVTAVAAGSTGLMLTLPVWLLLFG